MSTTRNREGVRTPNGEIVPDFDEHGAPARHGQRSTPAGKFTPYSHLGGAVATGDRSPGWYGFGGVADCGHRYDNLNDDGQPGISTGFATDRDTGRTMCYSCADTLARATLTTSNVMHGYVHRDEATGRRTIATWTGGELARVYEYGETRSGWGGSTVAVLAAITPDGRTFYGRGAGDGCAVTLRAHKGHRV